MAVKSLRVTKPRGPEGIRKRHAVSQKLAMRKRSGASNGKETRSSVKIYAPEETIGFLLWDTVRTFHRTFQSMIFAHGINFGLWPFLRALWAQDGIGIRELSQRVHMAAPTTLRAVLTLERAGLARRMRDKKDSRKTLVFLTGKGRKLFSRVVPDIHYVNRMAVSGLSQFEQDEIKRLLKHMRGNMPKKSDSSASARQTVRPRSRLNKWA